MPSGNCGSVPRPPPRRPGTGRGVGRAGVRWGWRARGAAMGVGWGGVGRCLSPDKGERVGHAEPARPVWRRVGGGVSGGEGAGLSFTVGPSVAAGAEGRGLAPPSPREVRSKGGGGAWGRSPRARVPRRRLRRHVSAGEKERSRLGWDWGTESRERAREGVSERSSEEGKGGHSCLSGHGRH